MSYDLGVTASKVRNFWLSQLGDSRMMYVPLVLYLSSVAYNGI